ncbi:MAG: dynamin family protein [Roseimicrobium sp.]
MIGQSFFDLRSHLGAALTSLGQLAAEASADPDHAVMLESLASTLKDPFVFVVVGEVNVGKSTFLNALFASDITKTGVVPTTDKIYFFKHGPTLRHVPITNTLEEVFVPIDFLKDFHIVDTPGTNSIENEHQEITERFVPMADLVIFVFSAANPWGASAWQFLEKVHQHWMRHVVFVLQQCDLRTEEEITAILDYMRQLSRQRFTREFPIFPVSAKKAYLARSGGLDHERLMAESGFEPLEGHITRSIGGTRQRTQKLENAIRIAQQVASNIRVHSGTRIASRAEKARIMTEIDADLEAIEKRTGTKLVPVVEATQADFDRESGGLSQRTQELLTVMMALTCVAQERRSATALEPSLLEQFRTPSLDRWARAWVIIEDDIAAASDFLTERITEGLKVQLRDDDLRKSLEFWDAQKKRFLSAIGDAMQLAVQRLDLAQVVAPALTRSRRLAQVLVGCIVGAGAVMVALALGDQWLLALGAAAAGGVATVSVVALSVRAAERVRQDLAARFEAAKEELQRALTEQLRDEVRKLYGSFTPILQPTREKLLDQEKRQTAQQEQLSGLEQTLQNLKAELSRLATEVDR